MKFLNVLFLISLSVSLISFVSGANLKRRSGIVGAYTYTKDDFVKPWMYHKTNGVKCLKEWEYNGYRYKGCENPPKHWGWKWCATGYRTWIYC